MARYVEPGEYGPAQGWAQTRLDDATRKLERAQNDERYSEWYKDHLKERITFYSRILATKED